MDRFIFIFFSVQGYLIKKNNTYKYINTYFYINIENILENTIRIYMYWSCCIGKTNTQKHQYEEERFIGRIGKHIIP